MAGTPFGFVKTVLPRLAGFLARQVQSTCDRCPACSGLLPDRHGPHPVCPSCAVQLAPRLGGYCPWCGELCADPAAPPLLCPECRRSGRPWDGFAFHGPYEGLLREMVLGLKFHGRLGQGRLLAGLAADAWLRAASRAGPGAMDPAGPDLVVPVPLHPKRLAWRGFNQSLELARELARTLSRPIAPAALARIRDTTPQSRLSGRERLGNIQGAFTAAPEIVSGRAVLLVDDVMTTGATVATAARALRLGGAARVDVLVVAR